MTRILFWNIENFGIATLSKVDYIENILFNVDQTNPDIFSIVELGSGSAAQGKFVDGAALHTAVFFLNLLNTTGSTTSYAKGTPVPGVSAGKWKLVPPVVTGTGGSAESVATYYRSDKLEFTGPWHVNKAKDGTEPGPITGATPTPTYPTPFDNVITNSTDTTGGQWEFGVYKGTGTQEYPSLGCRRPWLTTFQEKTSARNIQLFSFHAPFTKKGVGKAHIVDAAKAFTTTDEVMNKLAPNTIMAICGDFNLNPNFPGFATQAYDAIVNAGFSNNFDTKPKINNGNFFNTTLSPLKVTKIPYPKISNGDYPDFRYAANAYDQAFTKSDKGPTPATNQMILNQVIGVAGDPSGTNYSGLPPAVPTASLSAGYGFQNSLPTQGSALAPSSPIPVPQSGILPTRMVNSAEDILNQTALSPDTLFQQDSNFGNIRRTSDHMGIVIDI